MYTEKEIRDSWCLLISINTLMGFLAILAVGFEYKETDKLERDNVELVKRIDVLQQRIDTLEQPEKGNAK